MISYSGLTSYGKVTLPSVELWNGNFNIVKNPPSGIHTRRITKVGENNDLLDMNDDSGSRINEAINVYARGNNPMVSVQYSNHGNTGSGLMGVSGGSGGESGGIFSTGGGGMLPYRIMNEGAFRPPILRQEDLLPLSRLPRSCTSITSKRCRVDQTKRIEPDVVEYFREVHKNPLKVSVSSKRSRVDQTKKIDPDTFELLQVHKNPLKVSVSSKRSRVDQTKKIDPDTFELLQVHKNPLKTSLQAQTSFKKEIPQTPPTNIELFVKDVKTVVVNSNAKKLKDLDTRVIPVLEEQLRVSNVDHVNQKRISQQRYIHSLPELSRNVPNHQVDTTFNIAKNTNIYQDVVFTDNRPKREHSKFGVSSNGTLLKIGQEPIIAGARLKSK